MSSNKAIVNAISQYIVASFPEDSSAEERSFYIRTMPHYAYPWFWIGLALLSCLGFIWHDTVVLHSTTGAPGLSMMGVTIAALICTGFGIGITALQWLKGEYYYDRFCIKYSDSLSHSPEIWRGTNWRIPLGEIESAGVPGLTYQKLMRKLVQAKKRNDLQVKQAEQKAEKDFKYIREILIENNIEVLPEETNGALSLVEKQNDL